jgi:hypothetical protein
LLTRLICDNLDMQEETNSVIWQLYDMLVSLINPKSLAEGTGLIASPRKFSTPVKNASKSANMRYAVGSGFPCKSIQNMQVT